MEQRDMTPGRSVDSIMGAVGQLITTWETMRPWEDTQSFSSLTCYEAEALAGVFHADKRHDLAGCIIEAHASADSDEDDMHHDLYLALKESGNI